MKIEQIEQEAEKKWNVVSNFRNKEDYISGFVAGYYSSLRLNDISDKELEEISEKYLKGFDEFDMSNIYKILFIAGAKCYRLEFLNRSIT